jgi:glycosyltransferase involved in cell wall biosynthesis
VIIPARDAAGFLADALSSASGQTLRDIEILVVDDGSRDATWPLLLRAAEEDPRIRPLRLSRSGGVAAARNLAMDQARGAWIALLDADDLWRPTRLEVLVAVAEREGVDLLADDLLLEDFDTGAPLGRHLGRPAIGRIAQPLTPAELLRHDMPDAPDGAPGAIGYSKPLLRRETLRRHRLRFDETLAIGEDLDFFFACLLAGATFRFVPEALYVYRQRRRSLSRRPGLALGQAAANRRMAARARRAGATDALALLDHRQDLLDGAALAEAAMGGSLLDALGQARWGRPRKLAHDLRVVAGAARRRMVA